MLITAWMCLVWVLYFTTKQPDWAMKPGAAVNINEFAFTVSDDR